MRTREGMAIARAKGKLRGKKPKLSDRQQKELRRMYDTGEYSIRDLAELFSISRPTVTELATGRRAGPRRRSRKIPEKTPGVPVPHRVDNQCRLAIKATKRPGMSERPHRMPLVRA